MTGIVVSRNGLESLEKLQAELEQLQEAERERLYNPCSHCACTEICDNKNKALRTENERLREALEKVKKYTHPNSADRAEILKILEVKSDV